MPSLVLASASPRRRELLALLGVAFTVDVSRFDEGTLPRDLSGSEFVRLASRQKAMEVATRHGNALILGVDTDVVAPDGTILGKPADVDDARRMLAMLSGKTHTVCSGICLLQTTLDGRIEEHVQDIVTTSVTFGALETDAIEAYIATGEPFDKAGGYGIQGAAMPFVTKVDGDISNVIGLPLWRTSQMLVGMGMTLWNRRG